MSSVFHPLGPLAAALLVAACSNGGDGSGTHGNHTHSGHNAQGESTAAPAAPTGVTIRYGVQAFDLHWDASPSPADGGEVTYRVFEDADGPGPAAPLPIATAVTANAYTVDEGSLLGRLNAVYTVQACSPAGCSPSSAPMALDVHQAVGYFKAATTTAGDGFGASVALSADGTTLAAGAAFASTRAGAVYVFTRSSGMWAQQAYLKASNAQPDHLFGGALALSADGSTLVAGATGDHSDAKGIDGTPGPAGAKGSGAVFVFTRSGTAWSQQAYVKASNTGAGDTFGASVALSSTGDVIAVGAQYESSDATGIGGDQANDRAPLSGAAYVFAREGARWTQQAYVKPGTSRQGAAFGAAVSLSGDGRTLAVGASRDGGHASGIDGPPASRSAHGDGAVWVYTQEGSHWAPQAHVKASDSQALDDFGTAVKLSADGHTMAVTAPGLSRAATHSGADQRPGATYVFARAGAVWTQQARLQASSGQPHDAFGESLALSADGHTLAVGAPYESSSSTGINGAAAGHATSFSGAVYFFTRGSAGTWSQKAFVKAGKPRADALFGRAVTLSGDGKTLAIGAQGDASRASGIGGDPTDTSAAGAGAVFLH